MNVQQQPDGTIKILWDDYGTGVRVHDVKTQAEEPNHAPCLARSAVRFFIHEISRDEYLDAVLLHVKQESEGGVHHEFDRKPNREIYEGIDLMPLLFTDLLAGAVKARMWSDGYKPLDTQEWETLRGLVGLAWTTPDVAEFDRLAAEQKLDVATLSPEAVDLLIVACYAKRHIDLFDHVLGLAPAAPARSTFDSFELALVESRSQACFSGAEGYYPPRAHLQHLALTTEAAIIESRFWTSLLNAGWVHEPEEWSELPAGLMGLAHFAGINDAMAMSFDAPEMDALHAALAARNFIPGIATIGRFFSKCPSFARAEQYLGRFPLEKIAANRYFYPSHAGDLLVPVVESELLDEQQRTDLLRQLLEGLPGLNLELTVRRRDVEMEAFGKPRTEPVGVTPLKAAARRGSMEVGKLLVQHGARVDKGEGGHAAVARARGHEAFASWIDSAGQ